ncbi:divalent-cation tolerance protein CutA [Dactylosporangium sp. NPDC049525]|uniref:divalent-cation tolerance protein CutA n=1 Tax=Dactylosporangium sp. NPDC049525 TaxID=3154730 RepID=UPI00343B93FF
MSNVEYCQVVTATDSRTQAERLARGAVEARLAASAQVVGSMGSTYWWRGAIVAAEEWQVTFRTTRARYSALEDFIREHHNYEVPGIVCLPFVTGYQPYLEWITDETMSS